MTNCVCGTGARLGVWRDVLEKWEAGLKDFQKGFEDRSIAERELAGILETLTVSILPEEESQLDNKAIQLELETAKVLEEISGFQSREAALVTEQAMLNKESVEGVSSAREYQAQLREKEMRIRSAKEKVESLQEKIEKDELKQMHLQDKLDMEREHTARLQTDKEFLLRKFNETREAVNSIRQKRLQIPQILKSLEESQRGDAMDAENLEIEGLDIEQRIAVASMKLETLRKSQKFSDLEVRAAGLLEKENDLILRKTKAEKRRNLLGGDLQGASTIKSDIATLETGIVKIKTELIKRREETSDIRRKLRIFEKKTVGALIGSSRHAPFVYN